MTDPRDPAANSMNRLTRRAAGATIGLVWAAAVAFGLGRLLNYTSTPGIAAGAAPTQDAFVVAARPSAVMFLHPFCPCSVYSVDALAKLAAGQPDAAVTVVFAAVTDDGQTAADGALWQRVGKIAGVRRVIDQDGGITRRFDAHTSGQIFVYDANGNARFHGGVTAGRGDQGDSLGLRAARAALAGGTPSISTGDVFGCELN